MELIAARRMAETLMREHGLDGWTLVLDRARARAGVCRPDDRQIGLSRVITELHGEAEVRNTVLHEIAHALVGARHGHDAVWRAKARELGCPPQRCLPATAARVDGAWVGTCPAGHRLSRHRRPSRVASCLQCAPVFDARAVITWTHQGRRVPMGSGYEAELALLTGAESAEREPRAARSAQTERLLAQAYGVLPVGARVRLGGRGQFAGLVGSIERRGRTRYHVRTSAGVVTAPFALVQRV